MFLLNKFLHPVVINTTVNNHYDAINISNVSTTTNTFSTTRSSTIRLLITQVSTDTLISSIEGTMNKKSFLYSSCPSNRWGIGCRNVCKPCGFGVCHTVTGKCICPQDIYGEFCDLWKGRMLDILKTEYTAYVFRYYIYIYIFINRMT